MKYIITFLVTIFFLITAQPVFAEAVAGSSAQLITPTSLVKKQDNRIQILKGYLKIYNSPLQEEAAIFVQTADTYNLDYRLLVSIAGVESGFGKKLPFNSYNGWGWGIYGGNVTYFTSWKEAIETISRELKNRYIDKWGAKNVYEIGNYYASDPLWASKVTHYMQDIDTFSQEKQSKTISISI